ncbi:MAG: serine/threonine-protein kinase, partial [Verrucomicrobiota bacterium]
MTTNEPNDKICPTCGKPMPPDAPMGVCPYCLMAATETSPGDTDPNPASIPAFQPPKPEELAEKFPELEIIELIGAGGMGAVYKARQTKLDRVVALKILPPGIGADPAFADRFTREAKSLAKLNHPNIVTLYEFGNADDLYFFLMEFVDGVNLRQAMSAGRFTPEEALAIVPPVCEALQFAHDHDVVHRDIKPENLLLDKDGRVKIADFGVAKVIGNATSITSVSPHGDDNSSTNPSLIAGTPRYMAPEQTNDPDHADHRADIYAMGVVLYELLTGETPTAPRTPPAQQKEVDRRHDQIVRRARAANNQKPYPPPPPVR